MGEVFLKEKVNMLKRSKKAHNNKKYSMAIRGYNQIIEDKSLPVHIINEARVCRLLAEQKAPVSKQYSFSPDFMEVCENGKKYYKDNKCSYFLYKDYDTFKKYFNVQQDWVYVESDHFKFDSKGIPMVKYNDEFYYNTVTVCQYGLWLYDRYIDNKEDKGKFLNAADFLIDNIKKDGSFRYEFKYHHYEPLDVGWTSSMSQGQALSVFARAYNLTKDVKYLNSGGRVLKYLLTPISKGGVMDNLETLDDRLKDKVFFQQYVNSTSTYTLNGFIFTLIGLYDWSNVNCPGNIYYSNIAREYWDKGLNSLKLIIPYYDIGEFTAYDLHHVVKKSKPSSSDFYHSVHIEQMNVLYNITKDHYFKNIRDMWISYVRE